MCIYKGCETVEDVDRGLCAQHYSQFADCIGKEMSWLAFERLGLVQPKAKEAFKCRIQDCKAQLHKAQGLCVTHYLKARYNEGKSIKALCEVAGCQNTPNVAGPEIDGKQTSALLEGKAYCARHYNERFKPVD